MAVLTSPLLNKGTAFTPGERRALGLTGLIPPAISTLEAQTRRAYVHYKRLMDPVSKNVYLTALHDRNEILFFRLLSEHLREMIPIVNDFTVGLAMLQYHHEFRRPRGVYLSIDHPEEIDAAFANLNVGADEIDLIVATDAGMIPGVGDWGVGGIEVPIGKLAIFTAAGGIDPLRAIPVMLDAGTNCQTLLQDSMYVGNRHARVDGERYDAFIDAYVTAVTKRFPKAVLSWSDFAPYKGRRILERYRGQVATFNDDLQGVGAMALAAATSASRICGSPLRNQRVVIFGAGMAEVVQRVRPTMLIGASGVPGAFTEAIVREMAAHAERPVIFPLSNPESLSEATPSDLITWTDGRALVASGSSFSPVTYKGITYVIGHVDNAMLYPGLGLGAIVSRARLISDDMLVAAANAVSSLVAVRLPGASLLPRVDNLRTVAMTVALAVAETAADQGLAGVELHDIVRQVQDAMWQPEYSLLRAL